MDNDTDLEEYLQKLFPVSLILANVCGVAIALLLHKILASTRLHVNCKFLLTTWITGYLLQFSLHLVLLSLNISMELPKNKADPPIRITLHAISLSAQLLIGSCELLLAIERIISSIDPDAYYKRPFSWKLMYLVIAVIASLASSQRYIAEDGHHVLFMRILSSQDIVSVIGDQRSQLLLRQVNLLAKRCCIRRYEQLHGKATLNGRYQVKEAADLASSLQKVYTFSILLKTSLFSPIFVFCYSTDTNHDCLSLWFRVPYGYIELVYFSVLTVSSIFVVVGFIRIHPRLYRKVENMCRRIRGVPVTIVAHSDVVVAREREEEGNAYFEALAKSWN